MLKVAAGFDNTHLIFYNSDFKGLVLLNKTSIPTHYKISKRTIYEARNQYGEMLGETVIYGEALRLILGSLFLNTWKNNVNCR